ncbi:iron-sulfur cluster biosynthesis family protein [Bacillus sp. DJP31]|uniref:iron-sulfur cluster biosynthesis family protein n=1 Tax=Bacillus sp. DJP31 TaxID=3409789 RepID=UPI003BB7B5F1
MEITFTTGAMKQLESVLHPNKKLKLMYDTEGCGCVVSGVAALWQIEEVGNLDIEVETNYVQVWIDRTKLVFFDEKMTIDFLPQYWCYQLKSPNQMLNPRMSFISK